MNVDWQAIREAAGPYPLEAIAFAQEGLRFTVEQLKEHEPELPEHGRHVSGQELCFGLRDFAIKQYGMMAMTVLHKWSIYRTEDFGRIIFALVDAGLMRTTEDDTLEDFQNVYDFEEAFGAVGVG
ncbi:MAG: Minf_1886 family protein [Phycisphaerales bacterium JB043]